VPSPSETTKDRRGTGAHSGADLVGGTAGQFAPSREVRLAGLNGDGRGCSGVDVEETLDLRVVHDPRVGVGRGRSPVGGMGTAYWENWGVSQERGEKVEAGRDTPLPISMPTALFDMLLLSDL